MFVLFGGMLVEGYDAVNVGPSVVPVRYGAPVPVAFQQFEVNVVDNDGFDVWCAFASYCITGE